MTALVLGANSATGAYLARLLEARGREVFVCPGGSTAVTALMGPEAKLTPVPPDDVRTLVGTLGNGTLFALNDGSDAQAARVEAAIAAAPEAVTIIHVVDHDVLRSAPALLAQAKQIAALRRDGGRKAANAILHAHDSRLGPVDSLPGRIIAAAWAAGQDAPLPRLEVTETGPRDWGWTAEYVDAVARIANLDRPVDFAIGSGHSLTVAEMVTYAFSFFKRDGAGLVEVLPGDGAAEAPIDTARLKQATGWAASTWGRDLVQALCEGAAARIASGR
jgi:GDP-D-mannose dehydratase